MDSIIGTSELSRPGSAAAQLKWWTTTVPRCLVADLLHFQVPQFLRTRQDSRKNIGDQKIFATQDHTISI